MLVIVACFILIGQKLPISRLTSALTNFVEDLGPWGMVIFAVCYVVATVLMLPGSALSLVAGAVFGLVWGMVTVSLASTIGAACAFLIARYVARPAIEKKLAGSATFRAVDRAVEEGGWKIVALLRLSPAVPFNLQNYLYGLTAIRFWPCVLTSWVAMLPGTFLYIYLGYAGGESVAAATGGAKEKTTAEWVMLGVGLLATIVVTVYVTRLAKKALKEKAPDAAGLEGDVAEQLDKQRDDNERDDSQPGETQTDGSRDHLLTIGLIIAAVLAIAATSFAYAYPQWLSSWFGPPEVTMREAYEEKPNGPTFDHSQLDQLLQAHVNERGGVDYAALMEERETLREYIAALAKADVEELGRNERLALLLNAYNAFTLELILENWNDGQLTSIKDIGDADRWNAVRWNIGGKTFSLSDIEHKEIRPNFKEPRVHFALVCAAVGCPPLRNEAYTGERLEEQLASQAEYVHAHERWLRLDANAGTVYLTRLYDWYGGDFRQDAGSVLAYVARYSSEVERKLQAETKLRVRWLDYSWDLNSQENLK